MNTTDANFKPTTGPWTTEKTYSECTITNLDDTIHIASAWQDKGEKEGQSNAALIAEAGTVYHETGKTPARLAEENRELLEALSAYLAAHDVAAERGILSKCIDDGFSMKLMINARDAVSKAKGIQ